MAQLSGLVLQKDALQNFNCLANPGSPGGAEMHTVGLNTQNGLLAYDIARAAYRRTRNLPERMFNLIQTNNWVPPTAPAISATNTFAATLQTIAAGCETPELSLFPSGLGLIPATPQLLATQLTNVVNNSVMPTWMPAAVQTQFRNAMTDLGNNPTVQQAYTELQREYVSSINGRRDAFWALQNALQNACDCIYIQGTFFGDTEYPLTPSRSATDFVEIIKQQLTQNKALKVIICLTQKIQLGKGYEPFTAREYKMRKDAIDYLQQGTHGNRIVAFHPAGFPQRPKQLMTNIVIVDDVWAMVGTSNIRRRGLNFDGGQDVVLTDKTIANGRSSGLTSLRIQLMSDHLNLQTANPALQFTHATQILLNDIHEAFFAFKELLAQGGVSAIKPIWAGDLTDIIVFPADGFADPNNSTFSNIDALLLTALQSLATTTPL